jgi:hypothetical protein
MVSRTATKVEIRGYWGCDTSQTAMWIMDPYRDSGQAYQHRTQCTNIGPFSECLPHIFLRGVANKSCGTHCVRRSLCDIGFGSTTVVSVWLVRREAL